MIRDDTLIDISGLDELELRFQALGKYAFADALQTAVNDVAQASVRQMEGRFDRNIEGGPSRFTKIKPGKRSSSVIANTRRGATKGVAEASVAVRPMQARHLQFMLGERDEREPGIAGVADAYNFIPVFEHLRAFGIRKTKAGGLPRNALSKLVAKAKQGQVGDVERERGPDGKLLATTEGDRTAGAPFFGRPRRKDGAFSPLGFWRRGKDRGHRPLPLAFAVEESDYGKKDYLVPSWNKSIDVAASGLQDRLRERLEEILADMRLERTARASRKNAKARGERKRLQEWKAQEIAAGRLQPSKKGRKKGSKNKPKVTP